MHYIITSLPAIHVHQKDQWLHLFLGGPKNHTHAHKKQYEKRVSHKGEKQESLSNTLVKSNRQSKVQLILMIKTIYNITTFLSRRKKNAENLLIYSYFRTHPLTVGTQRRLSHENCYILKVLAL